MTDRAGRRRRYYLGLLSFAVGIAASSSLGLLLSLRLGGRAAQVLSDVAFVNRINEQQVWPSNQLLAQFVVYALSLAAGVCGGAVFVVADRALRRWDRARRAVPLVACVGSLAWAAALSGGLVWLDLAWIGLAAIFVIASASRVALVERSDSLGPLATLLVGEVACVVWGCWLVNAHRAPGAASAWILAALTAIAWRVAASVRGDSMRVDLGRDTVALAPVLLLPLLGIAREPSRGWLVVVAVACCALRFLVRREALPTLAYRGLALAGAPTAMCAALVIPLQFRELPEINHFGHEAQHLGWIASILNGRLPMAEASTFYGPLRESMMAWWLRAAGATLEQVRIAAIALNLLGLLVFLFAAYMALSGRGRARVGLQLWAAILVLAVSPLRYLMVYAQDISFGWVDLLRTSANLFSLVGAVCAATDDMISEIIWLPHQSEALRDLRRDPPTLVIGTCERFIGPEAAAFLRDGWRPAATFGRFSIWRKK